MLWEELTSNEFDQAIEESKGLCVLPIGALERHGQHMAVGCDSIKARHLCKLAAEKEPCVVFPTGYWLGDICTYHSLDIEKEHKRGGFAVNPDTLMKVLGELCEEIARNGFRKILLVNAHGGNSPLLNYFVRSVFYEKHDYAVLWCNGSREADLEADNLLRLYRENPEKYSYLTDEDVKTLERFAPTTFGGEHADFRETAFLMAINENLVHPDKYDAESGRSTHEMDFLGTELHLGAAWGANYPNAYEALPPHGCTKTLGKMMTDLTVERMVNLFRLIKNDEKCVQVARRIPF